MWRTARGPSGVYNSALLTTIVCLSLIIASPRLVGAARSRYRMRAPAPKTVAPVVRQPAVGVLSPDQEILIRVENGQRTLEKQTAELNAAIQRQMSQLSNAVEDSRRETQQILRQAGKVDSTQRLLKIILALLLVLCGGLLYIAWQLPSPPDKGFAWKGDVPDVIELGSDEEGIVGLRVRPRNS